MPLDQTLTRERPVILVVDDDVTGRFILSNVLRESGFEVVEAGDGAEGVDLASALEPDLVILDVLMPKLDGFAACAAIRALPAGSGVPVLMLTGLDDVQAFHRSFEVGATDFAAKPISPPMLSHRVRFMLRADSMMSALRSSESRLADAQRIARLGHWELDLGSGLFRRSAQVDALLGLDAEATAGLQSYLGVVHPEDRAAVEQAMGALLHGETGLDQQHRLQANGDEPRFVHVRAEPVRHRGGELLSIRGTMQDITDRVRAEEQIRTLAYYDALTGLPNRALFANRFRDSMAHARRRDRKLASMLLNLDSFKQINDSLGHKVGDAVLAEVGRRLEEVVCVSREPGRSDDGEAANSVARLGGDEFLLALVDLASVEEAATMAARILEALRAPLQHDAGDIYLSGSIGISMFPDDGVQFADLLKNADIAVHQAKDAGRNTFAFFNRSMHEQAMQSFILETGLRRAVRGREMNVHYQPLVDARTDRVVGVEVLSRWTHPQVGCVSAAHFVALAERLGLIGELTEQSVRKALRQVREWDAEGLPPIYVSINISGQQFKNPTLAAEILGLVHEAGFDPGRVTLEITESVLVENLEAGERMLRELKDCGFRIAIDDFGTGYSSLGYLKRFPIDVLKIDRAFIKDVDDSARDATIVAAIVALSHALGVEPLAEGVETEKQRDVLLASGCALMQGYLFARPMPAAEVASFLAGNRPGREVPRTDSRARAA